MGVAPLSEAYTDYQQHFVLPARRYEARSLTLASLDPRLRVVAEAVLPLASAGE